MARQTGNQVVNGNQDLQRRISEIRAQVGTHNANITQPAFQQSFDNVASPLARRQSSSYSMQGDGLFDQTTSFGAVYPNSSEMYGNGTNMTSNRNIFTDNSHFARMPTRANYDMFSSSGTNAFNNRTFESTNDIFNPSKGMFNSNDNIGYDPLSSMQMQLMKQEMEDEYRSF